MNRTRTILYALAALLWLLSCSRTSSTPQRPTLLVSIEPQRKILEQLAGDAFDVATLLPPGSNPETFEPTVAQRIKASDAIAYFPLGYLPFEQVIASDFAADGQLFDISAGITPLTGTHSHDDGTEHHQEADPHIWTSIRNGKQIAANMANALATLDPDHASQYNARYVDLANHLDSIDAVLAQHLAGVHAFAVWHPSLSYFANDYGLHQIAVGQESKEMSINSLRGIIQEAKDDSVRVFFFQREYDSRQAESLNQEIGSRLVPINPLNYDWDTELINIANELAK